MDSRIQLSIFTPTYNRAYILPQLYESLCRQTNKEFNWLIVDDGSTDETRSLIERWVKEAKIRISYVYQENSGKHVAINTASESLSSKWMCIVDSDDHLTDDAVAVLNRMIEEEKDNTDVIGFIGPRGNLSGSRIYDNWPDIRYARYSELYDKYGFDGETIITLRTDMVRNNKFPVFEGERFMPENVLYRRIDSKGSFRFFSEIIYCFEYRSDGYSKNGLKNVLNNPRGSMLSRQLDFNGNGPLKSRAKSKAFYDAIRLVMKPDDKMQDPDNNEIMPGNASVELGVAVLGLIFEPYYIAKLMNGKRKYGKNR